MVDDVSETYWNNGKFDQVLIEHEHNGETHKHPGGYVHPHWHQQSGAAVYYCGCEMEPGLSYPMSVTCPFLDEYRHLEQESHAFDPHNAKWFMPRCKVCREFEDHYLHKV